MNILLINKFHYAKGGAERYYLDISRLLREAGHQVGHLSMAHPRNVPATEADAFVEEVDYHKSMGGLGKLKAASRVLYNRESVRRVRELVRARRPHVAHHQNIYHQISLSVVRELARCDVPMVMTLHDYKPVCPAYLLMVGGEICERCRKGRFYHAAMNTCILNSRPASILGSLEAYLHTLWGTYDQIALYLCPSRFLVDKVGEMSQRPIKLRHLPNFLPTDDFKPVYEGDPVVVYAGRLSREKGLPTLIEAARRQNVGRGWKLRILGEGPLRAELEAKVTEWGLEDGIRFEGFCSGEDLKEVIQSASVVVVPSEWYENQPYAILEAFALGKPVIGSSIGGIPELVRADRTGWTFPPGDADGLGMAMREALDHPEQTREMGREARRLVEKDHNPALHMERLLNIYEEVSS
ncbi:MAG: glycosyltransferase family 4 protein [Candidatus Eisenbacteria bacterium]|uniref:Glycosyltransferase family 4 protein n=1 Tax=Eiseniibacteriota bacterium TaxID=2212470 RepID=A0A948WC65_UNCEI|nr:glycosyltransferase family 4 protein [Candidatus Eisenbacteria bacterium]MBU1950545.1 glycosyltransferase family 4 protein [Candidatus Eisenbacteria bacterium]MBU2690638.1 glycosyltransferase family 4 protein [Candidatus Eisenbacteria bacterium]